MMTEAIQEFVRQLTKVTRELGIKWFLDGGAIRGFCCAQKCVDRCPVTWVCWSLEGKNYNLAQVKLAGLALGLSHLEISSVVWASDNTTGHDPELRLLLLEACGLPAPA